ncbi:MAG TPA: Ig-like domain-containing protein [Pirellulaceae bacterium]|nr:Ig-like domain-containing protein [Pirellulaceae bacterium]
MNRRTLMAEQLEPRMLLAGEVLEFKILFLQPGTMTPMPATISKGADFEIGVFVQDLRGPDQTGVFGDRGVFSAMLDLNLNSKSLAKVEINEIQRVKITGSPTGGTFTLTFHDGTTARTTLGIPYRPLTESRVAIAGRIQAALAALPNIGAGNVEVIPSLSDPLAFDIRFQGARGDKSFALMNGNPLGLTGGTSPAIQITEVVDGTYSPEAFRHALRRYHVVAGQLVADYNQVVTGSDRDGPDRIDDVGGVHTDFFTGHFPDGSEADPRLLFRVRMNALEVGDFSVQGSVDDIDGEILLYSVLDPEYSGLILPEEIKISNPPPLKIVGPFAANPDTYTLKEDAAAKTLYVLSNDKANSPTTGLPSGPLPTNVVIVGVSAPSLGGAVSINTGAKSLRYKPAANANGTETFTYTIRQTTTGITDTATVTVNITPVNDAPKAAPDAYVTNQNTPLVIAAPGVLANDSDVDSPTIWTNGISTLPKKGTVTLASNGSFTYTPRTGAVGLDTFKYRVTDGSLTSIGTVTIRINANPTAKNDSFTSAMEIAGQTHAVLANDTFAPDKNEILTITHVQGAEGTAATSAGGGVTIADGGKSILYTPLAGYVGADSYTYTISDGSGGSATATVTVNVVTPVPTDITGTVYIDTDNDNVIDAAERRLAGVEITLQGTDIGGTAVNVTVQTDFNGQYVIPAVLPGTYTVRQLQPENLRDGKDRYNKTAKGADGLAIVKTSGNDFFTIQLPVLGTQASSHTLPNNNFGELGFVTGFLNSTAMSAFKGTSNLWLNLRTTDNAQLWQSRQLGWANLKSASFDLTTQTLTVEDLGGNLFARVLTTGPELPRYRIIGGGATTHRLIRIEGSAADFGWTLSTTPLPPPEGEGDYASNVDVLMGAIGFV